MKKTVVLLLVLILASSSIALFAAKDNWVSGSFMGAYEPILQGGGGGVAISSYNFVDFKALMRSSNSQKATVAASEYSGAVVPLYSDYESVYDSSSRRNPAADGRKKVGLMAQVNLLGSSYKIRGKYSAFLSYISAGMAFRQFITDSVTIYEGVALGTVFGTGHTLRPLSNSQYAYQEAFFDISGVGITFDVGVKWDFMENMSLVGGLTLPVLYAPTIVDVLYLNSHMTPVNFSSPYQININVAVLPYIGVSYNY